MMMQNNIYALYNQLKANPSTFLAKCGIEIPEGTTDTNVIIKEIMSKNRVSQAQYNNIMRMANMFRR